MKKLINEARAKEIYDVLLERFGEPIGKVEDVGPGVADERGGHAHEGEDPGNYGWGDDLDESMSCSQCGGMMGMEESICQNCGMMQMAETEVSGRHPGHAVSCQCPDCARPPYDDVMGEVSELDEEDELSQVAPPGREKQVKALKHKKGIKNPWAVAWNSYNKKH